MCFIIVVYCRRSTLTTVCFPECGVCPAFRSLPALLTSLDIVMRTFGPLDFISCVGVYWSRNYTGRVYHREVSLTRPILQHGSWCKIHVEDFVAHKAC